MHTTSTIKAELAECIAAARREGYTGSEREYEYTEQDLDAVVAAIGRKPTRAEWQEAGLGYVGSQHVANGQG